MSSEFVDAVTERAVTYADGPTEMYAETKALVDIALEGDLDSHLEEERTAIRRIGDSDEFDERLSAFFEQQSSEGE